MHITMKCILRKLLVLFHWMVLHCSVQKLTMIPHVVIFPLPSKLFHNLITRAEFVYCSCPHTMQPSWYIYRQMTI